MKVASLLVLTIWLRLDTILVLLEVLMHMELPLSMVELSHQSIDLSSLLSIKLRIMLLIRIMQPRCLPISRAIAILLPNLVIFLSMQLLTVQLTM
jgi:hypothetical protein